MSWDALARITAIAFDFDGVFTDDRVLVSQNGEEPGQSNNPEIPVCLILHLV